MTGRFGKTTGITAFLRLHLARCLDVSERGARQLSSGPKLPTKMYSLASLQDLQISASSFFLWARPEVARYAALLDRRGHPIIFVYKAPLSI